MKSIRITEDPKEMVAIAKEIVEGMKEKYDAGMMKIVKDDVQKRFPEMPEDQLMELVYITIYQYWVYGVSTDEYFYYDFANKTREEKLEYMTYRLRLLYGQHLNRKDMTHLLTNKFETYNYFKEQYLRDVILCSAEDDFDAFLAFTQKHPEFVVKPVDLSGGRGVHKASVAGMNEAEKKQCFLRLLQEGIDNKAKYLRGFDASVILEELIDQNEEMAAFNPASVNGVRLVTVLRGDEVTPYEAWMKIGRGGHFLASAVFGTMDAGIDMKTGVINTPGFTEMGECYAAHPDNGLPIVGFQIPQWQELLALAEECALKMPFFHYVGWDFVLSKKGWCIMEVNQCSDFMWQLYRQRGMKKEFEDLIGWKFDKEFWWQGL
ncbi:MAG: hypothetical protein IKD72_02580 [Clostridia bacterium]|nr:hypothetical protein [Clostridia bacterium]